jgi:UPF0271 protein
MRCIDLNCDLGEGAPHDEELMPLVTSANIACGGHAGNTETMRKTVELALRHGVAVGAHPGFEDPAGFGRKESLLTAAEVRALVLRQIRALDRIARSCGACVVHVKPHGALYNLAARDAALAAAVAEAVRESDPGLILVGLSGSKLLVAGRACGLRVASEVFADRTYQPDGSLTPRSRSDAMIVDPVVAVSRVLRMVGEGAVIATDGTQVLIVADTICVHGDGPHAVEFARGLRNGLAAAGIAIMAPGSGRAGAAR